MESSTVKLYKGGVVDLALETIELPNGERMALEIVRHPGGAAIAAVDEELNLCLLRQYRHAGGGWIWELPAGVVEDNESPLETARRELVEEAGIEAARWTSLSTALPTPGFCTERLHLFLAQEISLVEAHPHSDEMIEVHWYPFNQAVEMARTGEITDAKTVIALFRAEPHLAPAAGR